MPEFKIRMPNGQIRTVSGPDRAGAMAFAKKNYNPAGLPPTTELTGVTPGAQALPTPEPTPATENIAGDPNASRLQYALDQAQKLAGKGIEAFGRATGLETVEGVGTNIFDTNTKQIEDRNYQSTNQGSFLEQDGLGAKAAWTGEKIIENSVTGAVGLGGAAATAVAGFFSAPLWVTAGIATVATGGSALLGTGEVAEELEEKTGSYNPNLALGGGFVIGLLDRVGATRVIPVDTLMKMTGREVIDNLVAQGYTGIAKELATGIAKKAAAEGTTEILQEGVSVGAAATQGAEYKGPELLNRGVDAFVLGSGQGGVVATATDTISLGSSLAKLASNGDFSDIKDLTTQQKQAATSVARELQAIANQEGFNLKEVDVSAQFGAKGALEALREQNNGEITELKRILQSEMDGKTAGSLKELLDVFAPANAGVKSGKNKVSGYVTIAQMKALQKLVGAGPEGQQLMNALAKSNVITGLFKDGMKGGVSQFTDYFSPFGTSGAVYDPTRLGNIMIGGGLAGATQGTSVPIQAGVVTLGRLIDKATGRRSSVNRFVQKNKNGSTLPTPSGVSMLDKAKQAAQDTTARQKSLAKISDILGAPGKDNSPVGTILLGTGLDRGGLSQIISQMASEFSSEPETVAVLDSIEKNMAGGTNSVLELNEVIPLIGQYAQLRAPHLIVATPDGQLLARTAPTMPTAPEVAQSPGVQPTSPASPQSQVQAPAQPMVQTNGNLTTSEANYNAGKQANIDSVMQLQTSVLQAPNLPQLQKEALFDALDMAMQPASVPVVAMQQIQQKLLSQGVTQENVDTYFKPYVDRVITQDARKPALLAQAQAAQAPVVKTSPLAQAQAAQAPVAETSPLAKAQAVQDPEATAQGDDGGRAKFRAMLNRLGYGEQSEQAAATQEVSDTPQEAPNKKTLLTGSEAVNAALGADIRINDAAKVGKAIGGTEADGASLIAQLQNDGFVDTLGFPTDEMYDNTSLPAYEGLMRKVVKDNRRAIDEKYIIENTGVNEPTAGFMMRKLRMDGIVGTYRAGTGKSEVLQVANSDVEELIAVRRKLAESENQNKEDESRNPILNTPATPNLFNAPEKFVGIYDNVSPNDADIKSMQAGTFKPAKKRTLAVAAQDLQDMWEASTGLTSPLEHTPENVDLVAGLMAAEAMKALSRDSNAIGWYDRKLKAAKAVVSLVEPRITQSPEAEAAFDYALAVTSNGQAVADNFSYAVEVFREFMDTGLMPTKTWIKGGERNKAMVDAFDFYNSYSKSGANMPIEMFLDNDFTVAELNAYMKDFNAKYGTNVSAGNSEWVDTSVKGSFLIGPKIGQGFYQNLRGNYDPLTMDIWWMRMWNRQVGRPFESEKDLAASRARVSSSLKIKSMGKLEKSLVSEVRKSMGLPKVPSSKNDPQAFDDFIVKLDKRYQKFYKGYKKEHGVNHAKTALFKKTGTHIKSLVPQLQAIPKGPADRNYMRAAVVGALDKLRSQGVEISTADFQALMWYPEKQLFRKLGVEPGRGSDNDYLDAAKMLAEEEGITNDQVQKALPDSERDGSVDSQPGSTGPSGGVYQGPSQDGRSEEQLQPPALYRAPPIGPAGPRPVEAKRRPFARVSLPDIRQFFAPSKALFEIGLKGGKYENGIQTLDDAIDLSTALNIGVRLFDSQPDMYATRVATNPQASPDSLGMFTRKQGGKGAEGTIFGLNPGARLNDGSRVGSVDALMTFLHEVGHGVTLGPLDLTSPQSEDTNFRNQITGEMDRAPRGSFAGSALRPLLEGRGDPDILSEIDNLQTNIEAYTTNDPKQRVAVREVRKMISRLKPFVDALNADVASGAMTLEQGQEAMDVQGDAMAGFTSYRRNVRELSADPFAIYTLNPKLAKAVMPKTAALIKSEIRKGGNKTIQFHGVSFPILIAVVMAMLAKGKAEEEQDPEGSHQMPDGSMMKNSEMQAGALSPQQQPPGLLTQAA